MAVSSTKRGATDPEQEYMRRDAWVHRLLGWGWKALGTCRMHLSSFFLLLSVAFVTAVCFRYLP